MKLSNQEATIVKIIPPTEELPFQIDIDNEITSFDSEGVKILAEVLLAAKDYIDEQEDSN